MPSFRLRSHRSIVLLATGALAAVAITSACARDSGAAPVAAERAPAAAPPASAPPPAAAPAPDARPTPNVIRQFPALPLKSPNAEVKQQVGISEITVRYSSPAVNKRNVWGELVPYGKVWRTGANSATKLIVSDEVTIGDKVLPAGSYSLFTIPTATTWTFVVNRDPADAGIFGYDQKNDVLRVEVPSEAGPARERMIFLFEDTTEDGTKLVLDWAGKRVVVPIKVDTKKLVQKSIDATMAVAWRPPFNVGRYILESENDPQRALAMFEKSIAIQPSWWNQWWAAETLAKLGKYAEARTHAEQARTLGKGDNVYEQNFAAQVTKSLAEWEKK